MQKIPPSFQNLRRRIILIGASALTAWTLLQASALLALQMETQQNFSLQKALWLEMLEHVLLWLAGSIGIGLVLRRMWTLTRDWQKAAEALRLSEERYGQLVELSPAGIAIHQEGRLVFVNPACLEMFGTNNPAEVLGKPIMQFVHPDSQEMVRERLQTMLRTGQPAPAADEKLVRLDGSIADVKLASVPMRYQDGIAFQVLLYDQSAQKRLERAIGSIERGISAAQGDEFFTSAVLNLQQALESDIVFIGEYIAETEQVRTLAAAKDGAIIPNFEYPLQDAPCANVINQELCCYPAGVCDLFPKDAGLRRLEAEGYLGMPLWTPERAPKGIIVALYRRPISEPDFARGVVQIFASRVEAEIAREQALRELRESQARLNAVFQNIPIDLWLADTNDVTILQNPVSLALWGNNQGKSIPEMAAPEALRQRWQVNNQRALRGETLRDQQQVTLNGQEYFFESFQAPIYSDGAIIGYVGANIDVTQQKKSEQNLQQALERLTRLRQIDQVILSGQDMRAVMEAVCRQAAALLNVDGVEILQYDPSIWRLEILAQHGLRAYSPFGTFSVRDDIASSAILENVAVHERNFPAFLKRYPACAELKEEGFQEYAALPLVAKGIVRGALELFQRGELPAEKEWWELAQTVAAQAALAIDNLSLFQGLQRSNVELSLAYDLTLEGWSKALELRDYETEGHTQRVTNLTVRLAEFMNVPRPQLVHIRRGALLHDIGKIGIPDRILHKRGQLTPEEWEIIRQHPGFAYELLLPIPFLRPALDIPHYHHERWDGSGYPDGLKGEEIPLAARIFAVIDVWDAITSERPYHQPMTLEQAFDYLRENSGSHFDPKVVRAFFRLMKQIWNE